MRRLVMALGVTLVTLPAALSYGAFVPKPGPWHGASKPRGGKDDEALFRVLGSRIVGVPVVKVSIIVVPTDFKCNEAYIEVPLSHLTVKHDKFSYHGPASDYIGQQQLTGVKGTLTWTGVFTSSKSVKGTVRFQTSMTPVFNPSSYRYTLEPTACDTGTLPWTGKAG